mgnify:CR=1 FL=1
MILKKFKRTNLSRTKRAMIGGLVDYVLAEKDENGQQKCAWHFSENFIAATKNGQKAEMIALAEESIKSKMPVAHWMMSWNENEIPDEAQIRQAADMFLKGMGLEGHQVVVALHTNTQNVHAHIVVNRVHPDTLKVIQPHNGFDIEAAHKIVAAIEKVQGWRPQKNARYRVDENNQIVRNAPRKRQPPTSKAQDFENYTGTKSAQRIAQKRAHEIIENAKSWAELHNGLKGAGLRFEKKGSGAIVFVGDIAVKASSIDRQFSMGKLCKRLGEFQPGIYPQTMPKIEPEPVSKIAEDKWHEYMDVRKANQREHERQKEELLAQNALAIAEVKARQKAHRQSAYANLAQYGPELVGIARLLLPKQHSQEVAKARKELPKVPKLACGRFKDWLRQRNPWLADIWRLRRLLKPGMKYGHFEEGRFPKVGKVQNPLIPYREMVKRRYADMKLAQSRIDAGTALHLRCAGYLRKEVEEEMQRHSPRPPAQQDDLSPKIGYLQRILDYAFGTQGDIWVIEQRLGKEEVEKFNKEAEIIDYYMKKPQQAASQQQCSQQRFRSR